MDADELLKKAFEQQQAVLDELREKKVGDCTREVVQAEILNNRIDALLKFKNIDLRRGISNE